MTQLPRRSDCDKTLPVHSNLVSGCVMDACNGVKINCGVHQSRKELKKSPCTESFYSMQCCGVKSTSARLVYEPEARGR